MGFRVRIYYEDTDSGGIVYHSNYIKFCERARSEIVFNSGIEFTQSRHFVVTKLEASYIKPAVLGDILEVKTKLIKVGGASLTLAQDIYKVADIKGFSQMELLFRAKVIVGFICDGRLSRLDPKFAEIFTKLNQD
ncbi:MULTISPECIES: YbgC/FadM family acyl-CoA thioesterase [Campylobacter]|uniref:YbgC/FadM family acyl-CoA thioesterase n=1 Tax=Campylobacter lanienae TaxID=75658 RepID=A0ABY3G8F0_9BACT|nr:MULTISPECIES: YbgC/FadM family acyl-CoA thioesterase [Campylobacter]TWO29243.1 YbgC/FadM family acyl-CoA thioesterase [Campylobacter lanienae]